MSGALEILNQHLIDPEVCIRCNTCEETCPVGAITHDSANYVVNADLCNACLACISPCPTGSIDNWRTVPKAEAYGVTEQYTWTELPKPLANLGTLANGASDATREVSAADGDIPPLTAEGRASAQGIEVDVARGSRVPPWSAAHPYVNLYTHKAPLKATVSGNYRLTAEAGETDVHHVVLDFGQTPFPILEGQSIAVIPPGTLPDGRPHHARQYSVASPRNGERPGYNNLSLTVKRVKGTDVEGNGARGVPQDGICSNYLCDVKKGDSVQVIGPFGATFLMPNHPASNLLMICTGTGSAPMRAMTEYRRRKRLTGATGKLMLFFGARTREELPYFGPLMNLPKDFIDVTLAFSRAPGQPKRYVQDALRERAIDVATLLKDDDTYVYVCGLKGMEDGVLQALTDIANQSGQAWEPLWRKMRDGGRLHFETY